MDFRDKIAVVTGGSSGIGLAVAEELAAQGAHVYLVARDQGRLDAALERVKSARRSATQQAGAFSAELSDPAQAAAAIAYVCNAAGAPDLLINSAGGARPGYFEEMSPADFRRMMDTNYFSTVYITQAAVPAMLRRGSGHIVNIASEATLIGTFGYSAYGAAKSAVRYFSDTLRYELKPHGIRVTLVLPPNTDTPGLATENKTKPAETRTIEGNEKTLSPQRMADEILHAVARGRNLVIPTWQGRFYYWLIGIAGTLQYPVMDMMVAQARSKAQAGKSRS